MCAQNPNAGARRVSCQIIGWSRNDGGEAVGFGQRGHCCSDFIGRHRQDRQQGVVRDVRVDLAFEARHGEVGDNLAADRRVRTENGNRGGAKQRGRIEAAGRIETGNRHRGST